MSGVVNLALLLFFKTGSLIGQHLEHLDLFGGWWRPGNQKSDSGPHASVASTFLTETTSPAEHDL